MRRIVVPRRLLTEEEMTPYQGAANAEVACLPWPIYFTEIERGRRQVLLFGDPVWPTEDGVVTQHTLV
jgi:hypothetical protein